MNWQSYFVLRASDGSAATMTMPPIRCLVLMLAAAFAAGCGASPLSEGNPESLLAAQALPAPAAAESGPPQPGALDKAAQTYIAMADPKSKSYRIGPLDVLEITVFKVPELSKSVQVSEAGTINFPLIGDMEAGGKSAREVEQELTRRLRAKYLQNPQITVFVKEYNSQRVTVTGAVKKSGVVPMAGGMTLVQAIAQAGGLDETAENTAVVFRVAGGQRSAGRYDLSEIQAGKGEDPQLQSGDVIMVPTSNLKYGFNSVVRVAPLASIAPLL